MFETVSPEALIRSHRKLWYETLPVSLAVHFAAIAMATAGALSQTIFPDQPPHLMFAYSVADLNPAPPPPPPPPPPPRSNPVPITPSAPVPNDQIVAPTVIPDTIPDVQPVQFTQIDVAPSVPHPGAVAGGVATGDPEGVPGGVVGGQPKGVLGGVLMDDGKVHFERNKPLPMFIERQEYPSYPEELRSRGVEDDVIVRYIIDVKGKVREVTILDHAKHKEFDYAAVDAIKGWRFRPLIVDGEPREVVHELAVYFRLQ